MYTDDESHTCHALKVTLQENPTKVVDIMLDSLQPIGELVDRRILVEHQGNDTVADLLTGSAGKLDIALLDVDRPLVQSCQSNVPEVCTGASKVLSSLGLSLGFNSLAMREVFHEDLLNGNAFQRAFLQRERM